MQEVEPWQGTDGQIPNSVKLGIGAMTVGLMAEMVAAAKYTTELMYVNIGNIIVAGREIPFNMSDGTRNMAVGSLALIAAGAMPYIAALHSDAASHRQ